ncbi:MAG: PAS domain S-box protein, partial [Anaerolineaceae bacterium]|nr:PAS domain S-box protein [Anaerolineaceae bacterium]
MKPGCCQVLFLKNENTTLGYLAILADNKEDFSTDQQEILNQLSHDLTYGLVTLRTRLAHQHAEVELRRQHDLFRRMMETNPSGILVYNRGGNVTMVNNRAEELLGVSRDKINNTANGSIFNGIFKFYDNHYQPLKMESLPAQMIIENGHPIYDLRACFNYEGEERWAIVNGAPIHGENEVEGAIISLVDITHQREAEQALIESEKRYRRLFEGVQEGVWMVDAEARTTFVNDNMANMIGYSQAEMIGRSLFDFMEVHSQEVARNSLARIRQGDQEKNDFELLHKNGRHVYTRVETSPLFDEQEIVLGAMAMVSDISARHQRELELEAIAKMAKALRNVAARKEIIPVILQQMQPLVNGDGTCLLSRDVETGELMVEGSLGLWSSLAGIRLPFGEGVSQQVMESGQPYINADVLSDGSFDRPDLVGALRTVFCVPLVTHDKITAMLWVGRLVEENKAPTEPMPDELRLLLAAADIAASALYRATLHDQTDLRLQRLITLRNISLNISSTLDLDKILEALVGSVNSPAFISSAAILKYIPEERKLSFAAGCGFLNNPEPGSKISLEDDYSGYIVRNRRFFHLPNLQEVLHGFDRNWVSSLSEYQCYEAVPLIAKNQIKGVLELYFDTGFRVNNEWVDFIYAVATEVAIAIDNLELLERLQQSNRDLVQAYDATIEGWSRALDLRDQETEGHARRVVDLTLRLAEEVGFPGDQLAHIRRGALLHDIGKMAIPDSILFKTGPLSLEEQDVMRNHPVYAYKLLSPIDYLRPALDIPYCHHEHWDGSGYPRRLSGEAIPLAARIFTIVDVWDALCSNRSYRTAWSDKKVRNYI